MTDLEKAARQALEALNDRASLMKWQTARDALRQALEQPLAMQVRPSEFVKLVAGKENVTGIPAYFAEWPNHD